MAYLLLLAAYLLVCAGGRVLLRRLRSDRDVMIHLRSSQKTTLAAVLLSGMVTATLLGVSLWGVLHRLPPPGPAWKLTVTVGVGLTLFLFLVHYTESDDVQLGLYFALAALFLLGLFAVYAG